VYIFYGKEDIGNDWKYGLRISAADYDLPVGLRGFGCSFSNAIDIDGNGTPGKQMRNNLNFVISRRFALIRISCKLIYLYILDLAIGSYLSKSVSIFRTRPRLQIRAFLNFYSSTGKQIFSVESSVNAFVVGICVGLYGKHLPSRLGKKLLPMYIFLMDQV